MSAPGLARSHSLRRTGRARIDTSPQTPVKFLRPARADRVIFSLMDGGDLLIEITKHFNEDTLDLQQYSPEPLRITFTNPFELQDWLIENGYEYLV